MKKMMDLKVQGRQYKLYFDIGDLRNIEHAIRGSILALIQGGVTRMIMNVNIDAICAMIQYGIHDEKHGKRTDNQVYDIIQDYCNDGHDIDEMTAIFLTCIYNTGLYTKVQVFPRKNKEAEHTNNKKKSSYAPQQNGSNQQNR